MIRKEMNDEHTRFINSMNKIIQTISSTLKSKQYSNFLSGKKFKSDFDKFVNDCRMINCNYSKILTLKQKIQPYDYEKNNITDIFYIISEKLRFQVNFFQFFINNGTNNILDFCLKTNLLENQTMVNEFMSTSSKLLMNYNEKLANIQSLDIDIFKTYKLTLQNYTIDELNLYMKKIQPSDKRGYQNVIVDRCERDLKQQGIDSFRVSNDRLQQYYDDCVFYVNETTSVLSKAIKEYFELLETVKKLQNGITAPTIERFYINFFNAFRKFQKIQIYDSVPVPEFMYQSYKIFSNFQTGIYELSLLKDICN